MRFANMTQNFLYKRVFQKLAKNLKKFMYSDELTNQSGLKKSFVTRLFVEQFFLLICQTEKLYINSKQPVNLHIWNEKKDKLGCAIIFKPMC